MRGLVNFFRANPQVLVLLIVCLILGIGTFIAVLVSLVTSGGGTPEGQLSGWLAPLSSAAGAALHGAI